MDSNTHVLCSKRDSRNNFFPWRNWILKNLIVTSLHPLPFFFALPYLPFSFTPPFHLFPPSLAGPIQPWKWNPPSPRFNFAAGREGIFTLILWEMGRRREGKKGEKRGEYGTLSFPFLPPSPMPKGFE